MEEVHWDVGDPGRRPNISEDPLAPNVMTDVIIRSSLVVGQKRVSIEWLDFRVDDGHRFTVSTGQPWIRTCTPMHTRTEVSNATPVLKVGRFIKASPQDERLLPSSRLIVSKPLQLHPAPISSTRLSSYPTKRASSFLQPLHDQPSASFFNTPLSFLHSQTRAIVNINPPAHSPADSPQVRNADGNAGSKGNLLGCYPKLPTETSRFPTPIPLPPAPLKTRQVTFTSHITLKPNIGRSTSWMEA